VTHVLQAFLKDPAEVLDYDMDWTTLGWLGADTIADSSWTVQGGLTKDSNSHTDTVATVWLSGGSAGTDYVATCHIETAGGREGERSILIRVRNR